MAINHLSLSSDYLKERSETLYFPREQSVHGAIAEQSQQEFTMLPTTQNEGWGFWGNLGGYASVAWPLAMTAITDATGESAEDVRTFLDSRFGRHFADSVHDALYQDSLGDQGCNMPQAIAKAVAQWMRWKIGRTAHGHYGIPLGMPHLSGFVIHCNIHQD